MTSSDCPVHAPDAQYEGSERVVVTHASYYSGPDHPGLREDCNVCPPFASEGQPEGSEPDSAAVAKRLRQQGHVSVETHRCGCVTYWDWGRDCSVPAVRCSEHDHYAEGGDHADPS